MASKRHEWSCPPPEPFLMALEVLWLKAFGTNRSNAYEESDGMTFRMTRHRAKGLVRDWAAFDELCELTNWLERIGNKLQSGCHWQDILDDLGERKFPS